MGTRSILCSNTNCSNSVVELPANPIAERVNLSLESRESGGEELCEIRPEQQRHMELKEEGEARHVVQGHFPSSSDAPGRSQTSDPIEIPKSVAAQEAVPSGFELAGFCVMCERLYPYIEAHRETELHKNRTEIITSDNKNTLGCLEFVDVHVGGEDVHGDGGVGEQAAVLLLHVAAAVPRTHLSFALGGWMSERQVDVRPPCPAL
ncbi:Hypothetical predicted protein [Cloeon dipterum]|uniref:Uncharacterized protein n=1 Tax=Cloeon dipterum TaxID=197152 RepID=A0A8S1DDF2_9INSE|nr:Hypothetical predicted protein [Cloeon dipterum]